MTTIDAGLLPVPTLATRPHAARPASYLNVATTVRSWALTTDHKRIGVLYLVSTILALGLGGAFALLLRIEHLTPDPHDHRRRHLQPHLHAARHRHGVALHDPVDPGGLRQLPAARS